MPRPAAATFVPWSQRRARLQALDPFELSGRVAVTASNQGFSAHLDWRQQGSQSIVDLNGPLGVGGVHVVSDGRGLVVKTSRGQKLS
ncbi:MAG: lipoprotein insertase outer membrane protein LolB, partial [Steroidobacteraceae bacterium]